MRVLVYGVGNQGSLLAHALIEAGNDVTLLARGKRAGQLQKDGVVIRHALQFKTTRDSAPVITELKVDDVYDVIFVPGTKLLRYFFYLFCI
jgi:2-dehydropantoate 2-reductase